MDFDSATGQTKFPHQCLFGFKILANVKAIAIDRKSLHGSY